MRGFALFCCLTALLMGIGLARPAVAQGTASPSDRAPGRLAPLDMSRLTPEQNAANEAFKATVGSAAADGPFGVLMYAPASMDGALKLWDAYRNHRVNEDRHYALVILVVARRYKAQFEWYAHGRHGLNAGLPAETVEAIRVGEAPSFAREDDRVVYDTAKELIESGRLSDASYARALAVLGQDKLVELVSMTGFYVMNALLLNAFDVPLPASSPPVLIP